ncbi:MAG TPA: nucleoside monophosphate kinase [Candidatus Saccharimonadales bacterium]|nr:nucleoside monophosphate kinase [Candidatus Saccharimonadales bacterium]
MSNREIVLLNGKPGSGTSRLGYELERSHRSVEHISVGDTVRRIASKAISSWYEDDVIKHLQSPQTHALLSMEISFGIVEEALYRADLVHTVLLDGFPRTVEQLEQLNELAQQSDRNIIGAITTDVKDEVALQRMLRRRERPISEIEAKQRLADYHAHIETIQETLSESYDSYHINTEGTKEVSIMMGATALHEMRFAAPEKE